MSSSLKFVLLLMFGLSLKAFAGAPPDALSQYLRGEVSYKEGLKLLRKLPAPLSAEDEAKCLEFLQRSFSEEEEAHGRARQNNLADWMLRQPEHANACTEVMLEVLASEKGGIRWREYCLQKLALALEEELVREDIAGRSLDALIENAGDKQISFSGTALLGLYRLSQLTEPLIDSEEVLSLAEYVLRSPGFANTNKVVALQVAGLSGSDHALDLARNYVADESTTVQLRVSAIALLGNRGSKDDIAAIKPLAENLDFRLRKAAQAALLKLTS